MNKKYREDLKASFDKLAREENEFFSKIEPLSRNTAVKIAGVKVLLKPRMIFVPQGEVTLLPDWGKKGRKGLGRFRRHLLRKSPFCYYCERPVSYSDSSLDHFVPKSRGGKGGLNLVLACNDCNFLKKNMLPERWQQVVLILKEKGYFSMTDAERKAWRFANADLFKISLAI